MLYLRNTNQLQTIAGTIGGIQRGTLSMVSASIVNGCVDYQDTGFISMSGITGGRGPLYNYSVYDLSSSLFVTQSTAVSSALVNDLSNSTYLVTLSNDGIFAYTQSVTISCPAPPNLEVEYLVVGGGSIGNSLDGGSGGGVLSGSLSIPWNTIYSASVGFGATISNDGGSSSLSSSTSFLVATGGGANGSGGPSFFAVGLGGPPPIGQGGGAGSAQNGTNGVNGASGNGGSGSLWLDGIFYAGGGGGGAALPLFGGGQSGVGGGGQGGGSGSLYSGVNGLGGGAGGDAGNVGGSGVIKIRYSTGSVKPAFGGTVTESGGYYYHTFTGSGDFRYAKP